MSSFQNFFMIVLVVIVLNDNRLIQDSKHIITSILELNEPSRKFVAKNVQAIKKIEIEHNNIKRIKERQPSSPNKIDLKRYFLQIAALDLKQNSHSNNTDKSTELEHHAVAFLGHKYVWGGTTPKGFDCSGFTQYLFNKIGCTLPRTALQQSKKGMKVSLDNLKKGDLLYFNTDKSRGIPISHVGIYLEDGKFIHAANHKKGVIISSIESYKNTFVMAKRVLEAPSKLVSTPKSIINPSAKTLNKVNSFMAHYDPFVIYEGRYIRQSQLSQRKNND